MSKTDNQFALGDFKKFSGCMVEVLHLKYQNTEKFVHNPVKKICQHYLQPYGISQVACGKYHFSQNVFFVDISFELLLQTNLEDQFKGLWVIQESYYLVCLHLSRKRDASQHLN